jgi:hypothetical protein
MLKKAFPDEESGCRKTHILRGPFFVMKKGPLSICLFFEHF